MSIDSVVKTTGGVVLHRLVRPLTESQRSQRNLNPHAEARAAMWLYGKRYSEQGGGSMDFYDRLSDYEKDCCKRLVDDVSNECRRAV